MTSLILDAVALAAAVAAALVALRAFARSGARGFWRPLAAPLASRLRPGAQDELERMRMRLASAGRRDRDEVDRFLEEKVLLAVLGLGTGLALGGAVGGAGGLLLAILAILVGAIAADRLVAARAAERQGAIGRALPSAVDLLVTCLDAGLSLEQALGRVAAEMNFSEPTLAQELGLTASELEAGVPLGDALRRLARRVRLDELAAMCGVIAQASALGAPVAQTLREYAIASRRQRISMLEERAGKLATRLTLPLALCLLPAALLIILGPAAIQLARALE